MMTTQHGDACILIVDDEPKNIQLLANLLHDQGYAVEFATTGAEALQWVNTRIFDLILLDVMMPDLDGYGVCVQLKNHPTAKAIPVIFLTAKTDPESVVKGFHAGARDYVTKPFRKEELLARVATHVAFARQQRALDTYAALVEKTNRELQQKNAQLQELNANKDKFFSILAHDLKNPLSGLLAFGDLLNDFESMSATQITELITLFKQSARNVLTLLDNLLTWSRMQQGLLDYVPQVLQVEDFVNRNVRLLTANAAQKQITLHTQIPPELTVLADLYMLDAVLRNLLSNAIKFTPPGGTVTISAAADPPLVTIAVTDSGIGIPADKFATLFRIDAKYQRKGTNGEPGTGLGLILCKEFVEKHGGTIDVQSVVGKGTTFTVHLRIGFASESHASPPVETALTPELLAVLPQELVMMLRQAVNDLDIDITHQCIDAIRTYHEPLAETLTRLVKAYRFDLLQQWCQNVGM